MFPQVGSQIFSEPASLEASNVMEVKNASRDKMSVAGFGAKARKECATNPSLEPEKTPRPAPAFKTISS
jgi:hypothetical protein